MEVTQKSHQSVVPYSQRYSGHASHFATDVFRLAGIDRTGRPRYRLDPTSRPYLDKLSTAAVRNALTKH